MPLLESAMGSRACARDVIPVITNGRRLGSMIPDVGNEGSPRWPGPMAVGFLSAAMKVRFLISESIRDPKSSTYSSMASASNFVKGPSSGWFMTMRMIYLRAASPSWARVSSIMSDGCPRRVSTIEVFEF
jgi:hypothetical protein